MEFVAGAMVLIAMAFGAVLVLKASFWVVFAVVQVSAVPYWFMVRRAAKWRGAVTPGVAEPVR